MSENKFKVSAKKPARKRKSAAKDDTLDLFPELKAEGGEKKSPAQKKAPKTKRTTTATKPKTAKPKATRAPKKAEGPKKPSLEENRVKPSGHLAPQALPSSPDLRNLPRDERIKAVLGPTVMEQRKEVAKEEERVEAVIPEIGTRAKNQGPKREEIITEEEMRPHRPKIVLILLVFSIVAILLLAVLPIVRQRSVKASGAETSSPVAASSDGDGMILEIKSGMSATDVANLLSSVIDKDEFLSYLSSHGLSGSLRTGSYHVPFGVSVENVALAITSGKASNETVRIYDGETLAEIDDSLYRAGLIKVGAFKGAAERLCKENGLSFSEGWFMAGSYAFSDASTLAESMQNALLGTVRENSDAFSDSGLSLSELVIIASMVNRETNRKEQMPLISGIILNRYRQGMPLGIDATTRYELNNWKDPIAQSVFDADTPYNTRRKPGLPPSGIGCPGKDAILSVLYPEKTDYLYYLHDGNGDLHASMTYEEHLKTYDRVH